MSKKIIIINVVLLVCVILVTIIIPSLSEKKTNKSETNNLHVSKTNIIESITPNENNAQDEKKEQINNLINEAISEFNKQKYERSKLKLLEALNLDSNNKQGLLEKICFNLAKCYKVLNQYDKSYDAYISAISLNKKEDYTDKKNLALYYCEIANIEVKTGRVDDAINSYLKTISLDSECLEAYVNLSSLYNENSQYEEAIKIAQKGISLNNRQYKLFDNLGNSFQKLQSYKEAISAYKNSTNINPNMQNTYFNLALCYKKSNNYEYSVENLLKVIKIESNNYDAYYELGESYFSLRKYDEAKRYFKILLDKKSDYSKKEQINKILDNL